jgi:hypothetical protein
MAYVKEDGVYRCRLQLDDGHPCIDVIEHYAWDAVNKCLDETKSRGGLQIILRADAYRVLDNGELSTTCEELSLDNFGVTIITPAEQGEEVKTDVVSNFVRIFGLRDASELLAISSVDSEQLANAVFDVRVTNSTSQKTGKSYRNYWFAPVGETERQARAFVTPSRNKATLDKYRAKLRVECKGIVGTAEKPVSVPSMTATKPTVSKSMPPRQQAEKGLDLNRVWEMWIAAYPEDIQGADFYERIGAMFPNREASSLNPIELSAFCKANIPPTANDDDEQLPPF